MTGPHRTLRATIGIGAVVLGLLWLSWFYLKYHEGVLIDGTWIFEYPAMGLDLRAYLLATERMLETGSPYAPELLAGAFAPGPPELYYYAPQLAVALTPLADLDFADSTALWWTFRVMALLIACALMPVAPLLRALAFTVVAFSLPGLKDPIIGNVSLLLVLPMVLAWRWIDRPLGSAAMAAAAALRPSLGLFLVWQLLRRRWRAAAWTIGTGFVLVLVALPFVGLEGHLDYLAVLRNLELPTGIHENRDLGSLLERLGADEAVVSAGRVAGIVGGIGAIVLSLRRDREVGLMVVLCASLLVMPLVWSHHLATLILPAAFLAQRLSAPLLLLPMVAWVPELAPLLVLVTLVLLFLVREESTVPRMTTAEASV